MSSHGQHLAAAAALKQRSTNAHPWTTLDRKRAIAQSNIINATTAILQDEMDTSSDSDTSDSSGRWGGSPKGRRGNKKRDFEGAYHRLVNDYFVGVNSTYDERDFERRFGMTRDVFNRVYDSVRGIEPFVEKGDALGKFVFPLVRMSACVHFLGYGDAYDRYDREFQMSESLIAENVLDFAEIVVENFESQYLRAPTKEEMMRLMDLNGDRNFPGMFASWDCSHFEWKNCPMYLAGQHQNRKKKRTLVWLRR